MSKDLRFNKDDFSFSDEEDAVLSDSQRKVPKYIETDVRHRDREGHWFRARKRSLLVQDETENN
ncbi:hypothetical protein [uncultured Paraglaciecola sp.]|uniref:hypothetical protein n=1 Tax=uncultured Paraglaciecola sp. TaxID=1765024 RepID=UPI00261780F4|nr:hypothetical protein [uncultured Paraglaciecola sp.]